MAARAQADQDIERGRGLSNKMTQRTGEYFVAAEVTRRGAMATAPMDGPGIDVVAVEDARPRKVRLQVKTKTNSRFVWHMQVPSERVVELKDERDFYVFVDLGTGADSPPGYWVAPRSWVQNMVFDHKQAWLKKRGGSAHDADAKHTGIKTEQLERWKDRWDLLRVGLK